MSQLCNNVIITGLSEQNWEPYETTKQQVIDIITSAAATTGELEKQQQAQNIDIAYATKWVNADQTMTDQSW